MTPDLKENPPSSPMKSKLTSNNMIKTLGPNGHSASIRKIYLSTTQLGNSQGTFTKSLPFLIRMGSSTPPLGKANAFKYSLENSFQTNPEPYDNRHISEVNKAVQHFLNSTRNNNNIKLSSPLKIQAIIKKINLKKTAGPDGIQIKHSR
ncbi:hypothetical protein AVEN_8826-1 [Araneus ventricosus]|uniref:Uncharacterized protein n=1 Tax=Araneus ventricosus TaxID=182803 RepID=A0A4Y2T9Q4_ARAVE|nr:hypothetical protein AVEN_8826-1 [Araneus ventricosus]